MCDTVLRSVPHERVCLEDIAHLKFRELVIEVPSDEQKCVFSIRCQFRSEIQEFVFTALL